MKHVKRQLALLIILTLIPCVGFAQGVTQAQQLTASYHDVTQDNGSVIRRWHVETSIPQITDELSGILGAYEKSLKDSLQKPLNKTTRNSRLDLDIRHSRTGEKWVSFLLSARVTHHRDVVSTQITSRTYNMTTGKRIMLSDLFLATGDAFSYIRQEAEKQIRAYFPDDMPDEKILAAALSQIETADFSLHAMSLVLHYPAQMFYKNRHTLIEVTLMYPSIWKLMTHEAFKQTDNQDEKMVALTYDDGPMRTPTTQLLTKLMEYGARATFFVIGTRITGEKDLVQRQHDEGHAVASHNWTHGDPSVISAETLRTYRPKVDAALSAVIGIPSRYNRVPYGLYPQMISAQAGWPYIQWSLDTYDWRGRSGKAVLNTVKGVVSDGDIILFHDIGQNTADIAEKVIPYLIGEGYMLVTVDELFARDRVVLENEKVYYRNADGDTSRK